MALPPKSYFHLDEIARRWDASIPDLACYTLDGLLQISIMTVGLRVETGVFETGEHGLFRLPEGETVLYGPQPVVSSDLWPVFRTGAGRITRLKPSAPDRYVDLAEGVEPTLVTLPDLLVTRSERDRFEAAHGLGTREPVDASASSEVSKPPAEPGFIHRNGYSEVVLNGELFRLGPLQASIVRQLHEAALTGNPWRHGKELLGSSNAQTLRMVDLFKAKPNWRTLIVSDGRGYYRLNLPDRPAARLSHRAYRRWRLASAG